jgi:hypothetical protein
VIAERNVRRGLACLGLGVALHIAYAVLTVANVGGIGAPTDIGGGLIPLAGYVLVVIGLGFLGQGWLDHRSRR